MTTSGTCYTCDGVKRFQAKLLNEAIEEKVFAGRFTFHGLRAYYATQHTDTDKRGALPDLHANPDNHTRV
ncbi:integrase [Burkholderia aenigmatica]|uniref:integrase n=1 Tax=Burkholderia aenigmatica TaxID=2015348 RepID=UPI001FD0D4F7|nr:integrase [Burkholderia aenigmatica]